MIDLFGETHKLGHLGITYVPVVAHLQRLMDRSTLAMDRGYTNYAFFRKATQKGVVYVTKAKKNILYETLMLYSVRRTIVPKNRNMRYERLFSERRKRKVKRRHH